MKIFAVFENVSNGRPYLAEAEIIRVTETCFWLDRKNKSFGYKTRIRRDDRWFSFSREEALRLYLLQKGQELELIKDQTEEAEILLEDTKKERR